jgi:hypothetical protein
MFLYLTMKVTLQAVLNECNRLAQEEEALERSRWLRQKMLELDDDYQSGIIDLEAYLAKQDELLRMSGESLEVA